MPDDTRDAATDPATIPVLVKRRLQAEVIGPIFAEMVAALGEEQASAILDSAIRKAAIAEGRRFAEAAERERGGTSMADFIALYENWTRGGALEVEVLEASDTRFDFDVVRCRYAETYREMGLGAVGHLLSCNRDGTFCQGYDPRIRMERETTIMQGAPRCTFRYSWVEADEADAGG
ncbi:L-2-amino-thiazoline-4-carboxylic acid hydrolase [Salinarimonas chemoclinalis]|uniref:L-2-amino-thiazoline-4-carboxylic acid hydrolase n=1 Tax=Salinarimonas chemoclinalis TaxID=3241599 RepID=UPI003558BC7D